MRMLNTQGEAKDMDLKVEVDNMDNLDRMMIEFEDFLMNTQSEINELPQHGEPQEVDRPHYEAVVKDVVSKFKASLKGKPRLWFEMQYPTANDEPKTVQA